MSYTKEQAIEAYACVRKNNHSIPDEALDSMKAAFLVFPDVLEALEALQKAALTGEKYRSKCSTKRMQP